MESARVEQILSQFRQQDAEGSGLIRRAELSRILKDIGCVGVDVMLDSFSEGYLNYVDFTNWLMGENGHTHRSPNSQAMATFRHVPEALLTLVEIAASLEEIARSMSGASDKLSASVLQAHAESLRRIRRAAQPFETEELPPGLPQGTPRLETPRPSSAGRRASSKLAAVHAPRRKSNVHGYRDGAALLLEGSGKLGDLVDDLQEVSVADVKNRSAIAYWRFCRGLRLYRSETVTKALRLICSAPVPGLGGPSYLDVFRTLTDSVWEHHIFLFGGLVRDILRRKVGNDIDIAFSAPAIELDEICRKHGYKVQLDGDYILIGDEKGEEYLEGMVITHNGIQPTYHADFSMNWLFYDFCNDVIIDKSGAAVPAVTAFRCDIPCPRKQWGSWIEVNGSRVLFRYYKFLMRGYTYDDSEMAYVTEHLLNFWKADAQDTVEVGRVALSDLVSCQDAGKIERLRQLVFTSFDLASPAGQSTAPRVVRRAQTKDTPGNQPVVTPFFSAKLWWQRGWLELLKLSGSSSSC